MTEHLKLPSPPARPAFPVTVRTAKAPFSRLLARVDDAVPGEMTTLVARYHADFQCNEILHRHLEAFFLAGKNGPEVKRYDELETSALAHAARVALQHLYLAPCVHNDVLNWNVVSDPERYDAYVFTFAEVRILMDALALKDPAYLSDDLREYGGEKVRPCVIEVHGPTHPVEIRTLANRYLKHVLALLPEDLRVDRSSFHFVD